MLERLTRITKAIKMIANDKSAVIAAIGTFGDDFFTENAKRIRKGMSGVGTARNLSEDDIAYTLQEAVNTAFDPNAKWFTMKADNGMPFPCKADAVKAIVAYTENVDESGFADKVNRALEGGIGHNVPGYNEVDSELLKQVFGGEYAQLENNNDNIIKFIRLIPMVPKHQEQHERMQYMNDYAQRAKLIGLADACRIVADNKEAIREITSGRAGMDVSAVVEKTVCGDTCKANDKCGKDSCNTQDSCDVDDGGAGSGNWGHKGRKGKHGGSAKGGGKHNRSAYSEAFSAEQGSESLEGVSAPWINKSGRKGWGQGYVTAKNDWVNRLSGEKNTKADKLIRKWASKPPQDEKARASYDPIASAEKNITENGTTPERWDMLQLKKEARMFDKRFQKLYDNLTLGQQMAYDMITGRADVIDQNTGEVITEQEDKDLQKLTPHEKNLLMDLEQRMLGGLQKDSKKLDELAQSLQEKYGMKPQQKEQPKEEPKEEQEPHTVQKPAKNDTEEQPIQNPPEQHTEQKNQSEPQEPENTENNPIDSQVEQQSEPQSIENNENGQETASSEQKANRKVPTATASNQSYKKIDTRKDGNFKYHMQQGYTRALNDAIKNMDLNAVQRYLWAKHEMDDFDYDEETEDYSIHSISTGMSRAASDNSASAHAFIPYVNRVVQMLKANGTIANVYGGSIIQTDKLNGLSEQQKNHVNELIEELGVKGNDFYALSSVSLNSSTVNRKKVEDLLRTLCKANGQNILPDPQTEQQHEERKKQYEQHAKKVVEAMVAEYTQNQNVEQEQNVKKWQSAHASVKSAQTLTDVITALNGTFEHNNYAHGKGKGKVKDIRCARNQVGTVMSVLEKLPFAGQFMKGFQGSKGSSLSSYQPADNGTGWFQSGLLTKLTMAEANAMRDVQIGFKIKVSGVQMHDKFTISAAHEMGHMIHIMMSEVAGMDVKSFVESVFQQATGSKIDVCKKKYKNIVEQNVSGYANVANYSEQVGYEMFAQLFCEAYLAPKPRKAATVFKKRLSEELDSAGIQHTLFDSIQNHT